MELFTAQVLVELRIVDSIRLIPEVAINYRVGPKTNRRLVFHLSL